ncbi:MAG: hypothetical protein HDR25_06740 [Lachnospiraceae bacterium]|nr:hypothetical protein [Lachnospiraceae bacterium]
MDNNNHWNWNDGDARRVSSVYRDEDETNAFILVNPPQNIKSQTTQPQTAETQTTEQAQAVNPQNIQPQPTEQPQSANPQNIQPQPTEQPQFANPQTTQSQSTEQQRSANIQNTEPQNITPQIKQPQIVESTLIDAQTNIPQPDLRGEPQNNIPQPEFHPVVLPPNTRQYDNYNNHNNYHNNKSQHTDHSAEFNEKDISENKVSAIAAYLLGLIGIIIALLIARDSAYTAFHVRQALKMTICSVILELFAAALALFGMIPFVGIIFKMILFFTSAAWVGILILRLIAIAQVSNGEAKEPAIIHNFAFMK